MVRVNNIPFGEETFPGGEAIFQVIDAEFPLFTIKMEFENNKDIGDLMFAVEHIKDRYKSARINLILPFVPYGRADRQIDNQLFSLKYFANIINNCSFHRIYTVDPHSGVSNELIHKLEDLYEYEVKPRVLQAIIDSGSNTIHLPDRGASKKYMPIFGVANVCITVGKKSRNTKDRGKIVDMEIESLGVDLVDKSVLIVDDICVKGGTFLMAAEKLKNAGAKKVCLFITHCEDAIFEGELLESSLIDHIYTTDTVRRRKCDMTGKMTVYNILDSSVYMS